MTRLQPDALNMTREWSLIRIPIPTSLLSAPSTPSYRADIAVDNLPRRLFRLQNVSSGGFASAVGLRDKMDDPNIVIESNADQASSWFFAHGTRDSDDGGNKFEDAFAIVVGSPPLLATIDHYGGSHVVASYDRFWPTNQFHMWKPIPRDGAFTFKNVATGRLLCQSRVSPLVDTAPETAIDNPSCQWRLVDAVSGKPFSILYDSTEVILPPEYVSSAPETPALLKSPQRLELRVEVAAPEIATRFLDTLKHDHRTIREMLKSGHTSLIVFPRYIIGWRDGRLTHVRSQEEELAFGLPHFRGKSSFNGCSQ